MYKVTNRGNTRSRNLHQKLAPMHVTKFVRLLWLYSRLC